jgi:putative hydrolase of the HAD superfamily
VALVEDVFADPATRARIASGLLRHEDWLALDRGNLDPAQAVARASARTGLAEAEIRRFMASVSRFLEPLPETVDLLHRLHAAGTPLYCLSNMQHASLAHIERAHSFWPVFRGRVFSCQVGLCKPEAGIYEHLLATFALRPEETVFIDDMEANVAAAAALGIHGIRFLSAAQCEAELRELGCVAGGAPRERGA